MIIRVPGSGQYEVPDEFVDELNSVDSTLTAAVAGNDDAAFRASLSELVRRIKEVGAPLPVETLMPSDAVLPPPDSTLAETRALLGDEGLIPG